MAVRSDRLKKLELEFKDLEQWLKLGLVPKKDLTKHEAEMKALKGKIGEEKEKLRFIKETGDVEEYVTPRKQPSRPQYADNPTLPEIDISGGRQAAAEPTAERGSDSIFDTVFEEESSETEEGETAEAEEEEDPYSDRNRWKRGMLRPDEDEW